MRRGDGRGAAAAIPAGPAASAGVNVPAGRSRSGKGAALARPSEAQARYLARGLGQPGGKLPLFDENGQEIDARTIRACIDHGWAAPWFANPIKPDWLVCRLTEAGYAVLKDIPSGTAR